MTWSLNPIQEITTKRQKHEEDPALDCLRLLVFPASLWFSTGCGAGLPV